MYTKGDFHLHTNASDGAYSPSMLIEKALKNNIDILAVTDHDTIKNINEAKKCAGNKIRIIPGIELTTYHNDESIHILGYFRDDSFRSDAFSKYLKKLSDFRRERAEEIIERLEKYFNISINIKKNRALNKNVIARPDIANAIIEEGYDHTFEYIFDNILSKNSPAYVPSNKLSITEGLNALKNANAITVLAHPVLIKKTPIENLLEYSFDGIEAKYALNTLHDTEKYIKLAQKYNKIITAGSDCHGRDDDKKHGKIGCAYLDKNETELFLDKYEK